MLDAKHHEITSLDSLRGALSLTVVIAHTWATFAVPSGIGGIDVLSWAARVAVLCFFVLSGFVISLSISSNIKRHTVFDPLEFALARIFRIIPPLLAIIVLTAALEEMLRMAGMTTAESELSVRHEFASSTRSQIIALLTLCIRGDLAGGNLNGPLWSLAFEIQFYVVAGLISAMCFARQWFTRGKALLALIVFVYLSIDKLPKLDLQTLSYLSFVVGVMAFHLKKLSKQACVVTMIVLASVGTSLVIAEGHRVDIELSSKLIFAQLCVSGLAGVLVISLYRNASITFLEGMARYSYTMYIGHFPILLAIYLLTERYLKTSSVTPYIMVAVSTFIVVWVSRTIGLLTERPKQQRELAKSLVTSSLGGMKLPFRKSEK